MFLFLGIDKMSNYKISNWSKTVEHLQWYPFIGFETISAQKTLTVDDMSEKSVWSLEGFEFFWCFMPGDRDWGWPKAFGTVLLFRVSELIATLSLNISI